MTTPGPHERLGFAIGLRIGRVLRAVHFTSKPLQIIPDLGPWLMTYGHDGGVCCTGVMVNVSAAEANVSGALQGRPGVIVGVRWRFPREGDWSWSRQWSVPARGRSLR